MNKFAKRLLTGVLAGALATSMALPAFAATAGDRTVENTIAVKGIENGDTAVAYQIIGLDTDGSWKLTSTFGELKVDDLMEINSEEAGIIAANLNGLTSIDMNESDTQATASNVKPGTYIVLITPGANNTDTVYKPVFVSADYNKGGNEITLNTNYGAEAVAKKSDLTVTKKAGAVSEDGKFTDDAKVKDVAVGDTVGFQITSNVPTFTTDFTNPIYKISDALTNGLTLDNDSITVAVADNEVSKDQDYSIESTTTGFTVTFTKAFLNKVTNAPQVTITYEATVGESAATNNVNRMTNTATLNFSNKPNDESGSGKVTAKTNHYTFSLDGQIDGTTSLTDEEQLTKKELIKTAVDKDGNPVLDTKKEYTVSAEETKTTTASPLAGATFKLSRFGMTEKTYTTTDDGFIKFTGLDEGTYTLTEESAPAGYVKDNKSHTVVIAAAYKTGTDELDYYTVTIDNKESKYVVSNTGDAVKTVTDTGTQTSILTSLINNVQANALPTTGGMGTTIFYIAGIVLVGGAAILLVTRRRMSAR